MPTFSVIDSSWSNGYTADDNNRLRRREDVEDEQDFHDIIREYNHRHRQRWQPALTIVAAAATLTLFALIMRGW